MKVIKVKFFVESQLNGQPLAFTGVAFVRNGEDGGICALLDSVGNDIPLDRININDIEFHVDQQLTLY